MRRFRRESLPVLPAGAVAIIEAVLGSDRRVLLLGQPGIGKSTLVDSLARELGRARRACRCIGADPGSPLFGIPGAVCLGRWDGERWALEGFEALCTLDAGRFRLPLASALNRLASRLPPTGMVLVDGPGVVRGVAGAELLPAIAQAAGIEVVLVLVREGRPVPLVQELAALPAEVIAVQAAAVARRPARRARAGERTALWDACLADAVERRLDLDEFRVIGMPPPRGVAAAWNGRQIALLDGEHTVAMGEVVAIEDSVIRARLPAGAGEGKTLLVRDAARCADGTLGTSKPFAAEPLAYLPPPDIAPYSATRGTGGPRLVGRVGMLGVNLVNGLFGDPLLHVRLRHTGRSLMFDLGEGSRLAARIAHQVTDVFITHAHVDHIAGFLWLLRSRIGEFPVCRLYGPPGLASQIDGLTRGILWDRVGECGPRFAVCELHAEVLRRFLVQAGRPGAVEIGEQVAPDGVLLSEPGFRVRATTLEHLSPVLAFALEPAQEIKVRKDRLRARGLAPGPWLGELKRRVQAGRLEASLELPDGRAESTTSLAADLVLVSPGKKLVYATDFSDSAENRRRLVALAGGAHTFFCEATFLEADADRARRTAHLTTRACGEIAEAAGVARLVPFHFSRRYEGDPARIYEEIAAACASVVIPRSMTVFGEPG